MDDIYGDLENYEEENVVDELRTENKELKCKLDEYASTLDKLQKDFDMLSSEYKKLEVNYSSLLKTARAEIERKGKIITTLNLEKDQLVINALRNGIQNTKKFNYQNKIRAQSTDKHSTKENSDKLDSEKAKGYVATSNSIDNKVCTAESDETKEKFEKTCSRVQTSSEEKLKEHKEQNQKEFTKNRDRDTNKADIKENKDSGGDDLLNKNLKSNANKIRHRRKSMPLLNRGNLKLSSDEELEENEYIFKKDRGTEAYGDHGVRKSNHGSIDRKYHDNDRNYRNSRKEFDMTRLDDRRRDSSKDNYYKYGNQYNDSDRYRSRDYRSKYETRSRKYFSPDISSNNRAYSNDRHQTFDYGRHRVLETPTENTSQRSPDFDWHRHNGEQKEKKHKMNDNIDEPISKRRRIESINWKSDEHNIMNNRQIDFTCSSLQSPDYNNLESNPPVHQVKEIKGHASVKLEDPRMVSNKYILQKDNSKLTLSTIVGRHVDVKCIDKSNWAIDKDSKINQMPTPLRERPQIEDLVKEIYMDIDKPILNLSLESGEIVHSEDDIPKNRHVVTDNIENNTSTRSKNTHLKINATSHNNIHSQAHTQDTKKQTIMIDDVLKNCPEPLSKNYQIPKINKCKPVEENILKSTHRPDKKEENILKSTHRPDKKEVNILKSTHRPDKKDLNILKSTHRPDKKEENILNSTHRPDKKDNSKQCQKKKVERDKKDLPKKSRHELDPHNPLKTFNDGHTNKTKNELVNLKSKKQCTKKTFSVKNTVEHDLELSDETSDCSEQIVEKRKSKLKYEKNADESIDNKIINKNQEINIMEPQNSNQLEPLKIEITKCDSKYIDTLHKNTGLNANKSSAVEETNTIDIKTKLCDLFGDSSSLITPDDLGIVAPPMTDIITEFPPVLDNTQDAVDFDVGQMEKVQERFWKKQNEDSMSKEIPEPKTDNIECDKSKENHKNYLESQPTGCVFENVKSNVLEPNIVKTVVISTGVQNNCYSEPVPDKEGEKKLSSSLENKAKDNILNCQAASLKALATSTPHKIMPIEPILPLPDTKTSLPTKDDSSVSYKSEDVTMTTKNNEDVPDVRIVIKRRRKAKPTQRTIRESEEMLGNGASGT